MKLVPIVLVAVLAACTPDAPQREDAVGASVNVTASAVAPMSRTEPPRTETARASLTAQGWGPLRIGMTRAQVVRALGEDADPAAVGGPDPAACDQFRPSRAPKDMLVMVENAVLTHIALLRRSNIVTDAGVAVGDSVAKLRAAYPGATLVATPHAYQEPPAEYLTAWSRRRPGEDRSASDRGITYEINADGTVGSIRGGGPSIEYVEGCV